MCVEAQLDPFWSNFQRKKLSRQGCVILVWSMCMKISLMTFHQLPKRLCSVLEARHLVAHGTSFPPALNYLTALNLQSSLGIALIWHIATFPGAAAPLVRSNDWSKRGCKIQVSSFHLRIIWKAHPNSRTLSGIGWRTWDDPVWSYFLSFSSTMYWSWDLSFNFWHVNLCFRISLPRKRRCLQHHFIPFPITTTNHYLWWLQLTSLSNILCRNHIYL